MMKTFRCVVLAALTVGVVSTAVAGDLTVTMSNGRVTVIARDVPLRQILAEWARVGDTKMVNAEKVTGGPLTLQLVDVPEQEALDILLKSAAGYMTAPRPAGAAGASLYDRVIILATSRPPVGNVAVPPAFGAPRAPINQPMPPQPPPDDDPGDPGDQEPNAPGPFPPGMQPVPGMMQPGPGVQPTPGMPFPGPNQNVPAGAVPPNQMPVTAPRPGMLPQPQQPMPINPYAPIGPNGRPVQVPTGRGGGPVDPGMTDR